MSDKDIHTLVPVKKTDSKDEGKAGAGNEAAAASGESGGAAPAAAAAGDTEAPSGGGGDQESGGGRPRGSWEVGGERRGGRYISSRYLEYILLSQSREMGEEGERKGRGTRVGGRDIPGARSSCRVGPP